MPSVACQLLVKQVLVVFFALLLYRVRQISFFFLENALKKTTEYFLKFLFYLNVQSFRLIMEKNFIQMAVSTGHAVAYTIG